MQGSQNLDEGYDILQQIDMHHVPYVFPWCNLGSCTRTITLTAPATPNVWGDWTILVDSLGNKFSDQFTTKGGYLAAVIAETVSKKDVTFQIEFAYGTSKSIITRFRAIAGETKASSDSGKNLRNPYIPPGQEIYARVSADDGSEWITGQIRYYFEDGN